MIYKFLYKNRKEIKQKINENDYLIKINEEEFVHYNNFIDVLKDILPNLKISQTQWKMIVNIAQIERTDDLINIKNFFRLIEFSARNMISHPFIK